MINSNYEIRKAATRVLAYWNYMDAIPADDPRPTEEFKEEMDKRMNELREALDLPETK